MQVLPRHRFDKPSKRKSLVKLARLLGGSSDPNRWNNLLPFLEGMKMAHEKMPVDWLEKMTRKAGEAGRIGVIIRCAQMVKRTGVCLAEPGITRQLLLALHIQAAEAGWLSLDGSSSGETTALSRGSSIIVRQAEEIARLMDSPDHCGLHHGGDATQRDMRSDLTVLGVLVELSAAKLNAALESTAQVEDEGSHPGAAAASQFSAFLARLLTSWTKNSQYLSAQSILVPELRLEAWLPVWHGLRMARALHTTPAEAVREPERVDVAAVGRRQVAVDGSEQTVGRVRGDGGGVA